MAISVVAKNCFIILELMALSLCMLNPNVYGHILVYRRVTNQLIAEYNDLPAQFGPNLPPNGLKVLVLQSKPEYACDAISSPPNITRKFAVIIKRGGNCTFEMKVRNAQAARFNAVIVFNNDGEDLEQMSAKNSTGIKIPSVFVGFSTGMELISGMDEDFIIVINDELPFNINTQLILPFSILIGLCFLVMIFYMIYKCVREERRLRRYRLPKRLLKKLPILKYSKNNDLGCDTCVICLEEFVEGDKLRVLPCRHPYHSYCIDPWLTENRRVCPICKRKVFTKGEARSNRNRQSSLDSVTDTDDDTTPLLQPSSNANRTAATVDAARASATTRHGTFRRERNAGNADDATSDDENALLEHHSAQRVNPFDRAPNLLPQLAEQISDNRRHTWFSSFFDFFRRHQSISVAAPAFLEEVVPESATIMRTNTTLAALATRPLDVAVVSTQPSNNILNPNLSGSFKDDDDVSPPQSIYEPIEVILPTNPTTVFGTTERVLDEVVTDSDAAFIQTPLQGGIAVVALPNSDPQEQRGNQQFLV